MDLREFLFRKDISGSKFAKICGVSKMQVHYISRRKSIPKLDTAMKILVHCEGKVEAHELLPLKTLENLKKFMDV